MKKAVIIAIGLSFVFLTACSSVILNYDYDTHKDFSQYNTYKWLRNKKQKETMKWNSLNYKRIRRAVNSELKSKGYKIKKSGKVSFYVIAYGNIKNKMGITNWNYGYGSGWAIYGDDITVNYYKQGTLVIDIVDANSKQLVWRGTGIDVVGKHSSPKEKNENIMKVVKKILKNFPPPKD